MWMAVRTSSGLLGAARPRRPLRARGTRTSESGDIGPVPVGRELARDAGLVVVAVHQEPVVVGYSQPCPAGVVSRSMANPSRQVSSALLAMCAPGAAQHFECVGDAGGVQDARRMTVCGMPTESSNRPPSPLALSAIPAELAPCRPICPASTCMISVGFGGWTIRSTTTVSRTPWRQSQFCPA